MRLAASSFLLLLAATAPALPSGARLEQRQRAQAEAGDEIIVYRAKGGESLQVIAAKWFVRPEDWRRVQALNKIKDPANIPAGTPIRMRSTWIRTDPITAELAAFRGNVQVVRGSESRPVMKGMELSEGDIVETGPNGFATLVLPDASQVSLPSSSRIRLARLRQVPMSDSIDRRFTLEQGRSEAKVTPMANPASRFLITTPVAVAAVRGTEFRVTYTPGELKAVTEVTEGKVAVGRFKSIEEVLVRANHGAIATSTGLSRAFELLPAPMVDTPERLQNEKAVTFRLKPVQGASRYLVEIASDAGFVDRVGSTETLGTVAVFEGVPNGNYYVRAFAVDSLGLVGKPSQYAFQRNFEGPLSDAGKKGEEKKPDLAKLGDRDPQDYPWFEGDGSTVNLVDSGANAGGGGIPGDGSGGGVIEDDVSPVVPMEDLAQLFGDTGIGGWSGGGRSGGGFGGGGFGGGGYGGGGYGGGGGGGGNSGGNGGNSGGNSGPGPDTSNGGGNSGGGNSGANPDNGNGGGNSGANPDSGNGGGNSGGGNSGDGGNGGGNPDIGNPDIGNGGGGNPGNGNPGGDSGGNQGGDSGGNSGNGGGNSGNGGEGDNGGGVVVIPVDPAPPPPPPPGVGGGGGNQPSPPVQPGNGGESPGGLPAIPEPANWALMIAGFGMIGLMLRRRRAVAA